MVTKKHILAKIKMSPLLYNAYIPFLESEFQKLKVVIFQAAFKIYVKFTTKKRDYKEFSSIIGCHKIILFGEKCLFSFFPLQLFFSFIKSLYLREP